jgi:hypothetical protein
MTRCAIHSIYLRSIQSATILSKCRSSHADMNQSQLSKADSKVLAQVFDPESGPDRPEVIIDPYLPADRHVVDADVLEQLKMREKDAIRLIEQFEKSESRTDHDRQGAYRKALSLLDEIVNQQPCYASVLNNRSQLRRWYFGDRNLLIQARTESESEREVAARGTLRDLKQCTNLASPLKPADAVSAAQGRLLAQAYTQLGALYYAAAKDLNNTPPGNGTVEPIDATIEAWTKEDFEEEASRLFYLGGLYGNEVAKALAVHTNPQAKLCGNIVKEAMRKEMEMLS